MHNKCFLGPSLQSVLYSENLYVHLYYILKALVEATRVSSIFFFFMIPIVHQQDFCIMIIKPLFIILLSIAMTLAREQSVSICQMKPVILKCFLNNTN